MASSAHEQPHLFPNLHGGATTAPPPTPSTNPTSLLSTPDAADALSCLLHRLPPNLSLPSRRSSSSSSAATATCPPSITLSDTETLSSFSQLGFAQLGFAQLTNHSVPSQLANSAESEALKLFDLPRDKKEALFQNNWPLGYDGEDEEDEEFRIKHGESFRLDPSCSTNPSSELAITSLSEFSLALQKLGLNIVDALMETLEVENPIGNDPTRYCSIMWISESRSRNTSRYSGGFYPYVVGLQYQIRSEKHSLHSDSGWVSVLPHVDSILVTLGDIAQVWSNGKLKKVRGRPMAIVEDSNKNDSHCITMSLLITLPIESTVAPILPKTISSSNNDQKEEEDEDKDDDDHSEKQIGGDEGEDERVFNSFEFEDYAWRVYHERLLFKDPLDRYRRVA